MPTPFTHLFIAQHLLGETELPAPARALFQTELPAYLLGSIIADQRAADNADRSVTHFYRYDRPMDEHPWRVMLATHPVLKKPRTEAHRAFLAGYVAHLAADEYWSRHMLRPHFALANWGQDLRWRFFVLHFLLTWMDERDEARLPSDHSSILRRSQPHTWLPFMDDERIVQWRDYIAHELEDTSETVSIFAGRVGITPRQFRDYLDSPGWMQTALWDHVTFDDLHAVETAMLDFSREQMLIYLNETV